MIQKLISSLLTFLLSFNVLPSNKVTNPPTNRTTLLFSGDVMLGRSVMGESQKLSDSYYPFRKVADFTKNADITFVNLENPIISDCKPHTGGFTFCTTPEIAKGLDFAGIDIVTLANNHTGNYGEKGLEETKKYLSDLGITYTGVGDLVIKEVNNIKFGFLGFDYVFKKLKDEDLKLIQDSDKLVDVLVVSPHWGDEYTYVANKFQKETAEKFIENGADLVIGHHPHWVQNSEIVNGVPVYYSLGNFVFDQMWSEETKKGMLVKFTFDPPNGEARAKIVKVEEFKTYISKIGQPEIVE